MKLTLTDWDTSPFFARKYVAGTKDVAVSVYTPDNSDFGIEIEEEEWEVRAHRIPGPNAKRREVIVGTIGAETRRLKAKSLAEAMAEVDEMLKRASQ